MAQKNIITYGDPLLRERACEVVEFDARLAQLLDDMTETMIVKEGVGLAAPQVGILKRVCVVSLDGENVYELINPVIVNRSGTQKGPEGCLSVPNIRGQVTRPKKITVKSKDRQGKDVIFKVKDYLAVVFCHEMDHLDGVLFIDKMEGGECE